LRPDLNFATKTFGSSHRMLIHISCPGGGISHEANTLEKVHIDAKEKYSKLAQETSNVWEMHGR
jgi:hypothetical protein